MLMGGLVLSTGMALAQTTVTGKVVSQEDGEPVWRICKNCRNKDWYSD